MTPPRDGRMVVVFASRDSVHAAAAEKLAKEMGGKYVDRLTTNLDDLVLVAKYKVVEPVVVVVLLAGRVIVRIPRLVTSEELVRDLHGIT